MNKLKRINFLGIIIVIFVLIIIKKNFFEKSSKDEDGKIKIGILQTISHPALDNARIGFVDTLKSELKDKIEFVFQNADGSVIQAQTIAAQFSVDPKIKAIFAIATPAVLAIHNIEKIKPIFIAAVTDPSSLDLVYKDSNVCGSSDMLDVGLEVDFLTKLLPNVKKVAILFNTNEPNSKILVEKMKNELGKKNIQYSEVGVSSETDIPIAATSAFSNSDAVLTPTDNTVASTIQTISDIALKFKKPLIVSDNLLISSGALASLGIDYKVSGENAARIAIEVLTTGKKPDQIPLAMPKIEKGFVNKKTMNSLGLMIPKDLEEKIILVE